MPAISKIRRPNIFIYSPVLCAIILKIMRETSYTIDINSFIPIILILFFFIIPYVLKNLGRYTSSGKYTDRPAEKPRDSMHPETMHDYIEEPPVGRDYENFSKESFSNKPITPKWF
jgi:hypothetical protein